MIPTAGLGFKLDHLSDVLVARAPGLWLEVHAENYMIDGGPRLAALDAVGADYRISLHGIGLSILSPGSPDPGHLRRFRRLIDRVNPVLISDHLAWQQWHGVHYADFLPFPRTQEALSRAITAIKRTQDALGRRLLIENPSNYVLVEGHEMDEPEFLNQLAHRSGCGLLMDVNNVFISAANLGTSAEDYLAAIDADYVGEIHLAGHSIDPAGELLIDSHATNISESVWQLYSDFISRIGGRPTLIERDDNIPSFAELMTEAQRANDLLAPLRIGAFADA
jgi:uncharacterized protein